MFQRKVRTMFISDVHLGTSACRADYLLEFLNEVEAERIVLVGDIIDLISMKKRVYLPSEHQAVVDKLLRLAESGVEVIYIPGNHDHLFRKFCGQTISNIKLKRNMIYKSLDGRRFFVSHGDEFDAILHCSGSGALIRIGEVSHGFLLWLNTFVNGLRKTLGLPYWSLASKVKSRIGKAAEFIIRYENVAAFTAKKEKVDGFICGHIHCASMKQFPEVMYCNSGDWVEHCTALVEDLSGMFSVVHWSEKPEMLISERELIVEDLADDIASVAV